MAQAAKNSTSAASLDVRLNGPSLRPRSAPRRPFHGTTQLILARWSKICGEQNYEIAAVETSVHAVDLFDWQPRFPLCILFGHEVDGLRPDLLALCDTHVRIPMLGRKHSLNVATAGGVVLYELLRKYRQMVDKARLA